MSEIIDFPRGTYGTEITGPFPGQRFFLSVGGYKVPHVELRPLPEESEFDWMLLVDGRLGHDVKTEEISYWAPALANAMAVAAGYSCFGENCQPSNPYRVRFGPLGGEGVQP